MSKTSCVLRLWTAKRALRGGTGSISMCHLAGLSAVQLGACSGVQAPFPRAVRRKSKAAPRSMCVSPTAATAPAFFLSGLRLDRVLGTR